MALRLIEFVLQEKEEDEVKKLLNGFKLLEHSRLRLEDSKILVRILLEAEKSEAVLDALEKYASQEKRVLILPVDATLPREEVAFKNPPGEKTRERIDREELYQSIKDAARCSRTYLAMTILSTIVAAVGIYQNSVSIIIGAMVIAPLLGPNIALALGTTLGDLALLRHSLLTSLTGIGIITMLSIIFGLLIQVNPEAAEIALRIRLGIGNFAVALASGCAGALAFTTGLSVILIGVMVAVALLPPLVTFGMLLGNGLTSMALNALELFVMNLICINLAAIITFLIQGVHPTTWWEKDRAIKATRIAIGLWTLLLIILVGAFLRLQGRI